ncbi:hypothetical protein JTB14_023036 [Gonioctena quinquepunctata]|nr:hypothetical protein JTB14_023036 [Gonioctena quinquepunctata]
MKRGLPAEEDRIKSVEPVKKEPISDKGLKRVRWKSRKKLKKGTERGSSASMPAKPTFSQVIGGVRVLRKATEGLLELLTLSVDLQSAEKLRITGFVIINYKIGHKTLRPRSGKPKGPHLFSLPNLAPQVSNKVQ